MTFDVLIDGRSFRVEMRQSEGRLACLVDGKPVDVDAIITDRDVLSLVLAGRSYEIKRERVGPDQHILVGVTRYASEVRDPRSLRQRRAAGDGAEGPRKLTAPMPGKVVRVLAPAETAVEQGQGVIVVEAMKMQNELKSQKKGVVKQVLVSEGASVTAGEVLAIIE